MKYEVDGRIFDSEDEAIQYCAEEMISTANITEIEEEEIIGNSPEKDESLDESGAVTEREKQGAIILEHYNEIKDKTLKGMVLSTALGQETKHDKKFLPKRTTENLVKESYRFYLEELADEDSKFCRFCGREWTRIAKGMKENLESLTKQHQELETPLPIIRVFHVRAKHPQIWSFIKDLFKIPESQKFKHAGEPYTSNPESCSGEDLENLSAEEIGERIGKDPELRRKFFKEWMLRLQKKEK